MITACYLGDLARVKRLSTNVDCADNVGVNPILAASYNGHLHIVQWLVAKGANVNVHSLTGCTPVIAAVRSSSLPLVRFLVEHGSDLHAQDQWGRTAFYVACNSNRFDIARYLYATGADIRKPHMDGRTPLSESAFSNINITEWLLKKGALNNADGVNLDVLLDLMIVNTFQSYEFPKLLMRLAKHPGVITSVLQGLKALPGDLVRTIVDYADVSYGREWRNVAACLDQVLLLKGTLNYAMVS
jgi:ankyrin repeat protein